MLLKKLNKMNIFTPVEQETECIPIEKLEVDTDKYTLENICFSIGISGAVVQAFMNPLEVLRYRSMADLKSCSFSHFTTKGWLSDLMGKNTGRGELCNGCLDSTNPLRMAKDLVNEFGVRSLFKGIGISTLLFSAKNVAFVYGYEKCKFFFLFYFSGKNFDMNFLQKNIFERF